MSEDEPILAAPGPEPKDLLHPVDRRAPTSIYEYRDRKGSLLYVAARYADNKDFRPWFPNGNGRFSPGYPEERVPYHLPELSAALRADPNRTIYICEGEKDADAIWAAGGIATCAAGGALAWHADDREGYAVLLQMVGVWKVRIVAHRDQAGLEYARNVIASLGSVGIASTDVEVVQAALDRDGADAADHLSEGFGLDEFVPVDLFAPPLEPPLETKLRFLPGREFRKQELAKIEPLLGEGNDALMMPGSLLLLAGIGGAGKTTLATHAIAHWSAGLPWFGIHIGRPLKIVVIENEGPHDPYARKVDEFAERFSECCCSGEPHGSAHGIDENTFFLDAPWGRFSFDDKGLAAELNAFVRETEADLVVANPLGRLGMKGAGTPEETREFLQLLANAGLNEDFAALLLHHLAKVNKAVPLVQQVSGDWGPHPDTIMILEQAGERMSKLSFGKVRWGDQGRQPLLLRWLTDPDGPVGYHADSGIKVITDRELYERIDAFIRQAGKPVGITAITRGVTGQTERIRVLVAEGCDSGRYRKHGGDRRPVYTVPSGDGDDEGEQEAMEI